MGSGWGEAFRGRGGRAGSNVADSCVTEMPVNYLKLNYSLIFAKGASQWIVSGHGLLFLTFLLVSYLPLYGIECCNELYFLESWTVHTEGL